MAEHRSHQSVPSSPVKNPLKSIIPPKPISNISSSQILSQSTLRSSLQTCSDPATCCPAVIFDLCADDDCSSFEQVVSSSVCSACVLPCNKQDCQMSNVPDKCNDHCLVVPCTDSSHIDPDCIKCFNDCTDIVCDIKPCDGSNGCPGSIEELFCCTDYHAYFNDSVHVDDTQDQLAWKTAIDSFLSPSASVPQQANSSSEVYLNNLNTKSEAEQHTAIESFLHGYPESSYQSPLRLNSAASPSSTMHNSDSNQSFTQPEVQGANAFSLQVPETSQGSNGYVCRWANCHATYLSLSELVGHVNLIHLHPTNMTDSQSRVTIQTQQTDSSFSSGAGSVSCLWDDCHAFPNVYSIPSSSTTQEADAAFNLLSSHFLQDHLGLTDTFLSFPDANADDVSESAPSLSHSHSSHLSMDTTDESDVITPPSSSASPAPLHDCTLPHVCRWRGCEQQFASCDQLTTHLTLQHVGSGKSHYICQWEGCHRDGDQGFTSKQKILRHLQSHTGHRPFQCEICNQNFSEAATLQQHMRRHTQEKPYVCDFPGCNKAFAITGALTIHKRTHNGYKPFKCTYCDRGFSESSNLSKHLRTHTGARPYPCTVVGCDKSFARPDQLARHMNVHLKKSQGLN